MTAFRAAARAALLVLVALPLAVGRAAAQHHAHHAAGEGLGSVHFATSCAPSTAPEFDRGVALLHSFEFGAAIRAFDGVLAADSTCAMAHWGIAMARWSNPTSMTIRPTAAVARGQAAAAAAQRLAPRATERERGYIAAVAALYADHARVDQRTRVAAYERAMATLSEREPADAEAATFHALALIAAAPPTDKTYANFRRAGAILERLWTAQPQHPGLAHYIIHAYDVPALAEQAAAAARRYADIAPAAAHALHMPSHTFTRLGLWQASVETNRRSADAAARDSSPAEVLHALDYQAYAYLQMRRDSAARAVVERLPAVAAKFDPDAITGAAPGYAGLFALAAIPARYALERNAWREAAELRATATAYPYTEAMTYFARALGAARGSGPIETARAAVDSLAAIHRVLLGKRETYWAEQVAIQRLGAQAWVALAEGRRDDALAAAREAVAREAATEKSGVTPGPLAPAREQLADMLLQLGRPAEALAEYRRTLATEPGRYRALDGARRAAQASGERSAAAAYDAQLAALTRTAAR